MKTIQETIPTVNPRGYKCMNKSSSAAPREISPFIWNVVVILKGGGRHFGNVRTHRKLTIKPTAKISGRED